MVGDWMVTDEIQAKINAKEIQPGTPEYNRILNTAKLAAGSIALLYDFKVDEAVSSADIAVKNNQLVYRPVVQRPNRNSRYFRTTRQQTIEAIEAEKRAIRERFGNDISFAGLRGQRYQTNSPLPERELELDLLEFRSFHNFLKGSNQT